MPSTNIRRPICVGTRPALTWGLSKQPKILQILHHVADRCRADFFAEVAGQRAATDGIAAGQIAFDDAAKHLARAVVHVVQHCRLFVIVVLCSELPLKGACRKRQSGLHLRVTGGIPGTIKKEIPCALLDEI